MATANGDNSALVRQVQSSTNLSRPTDQKGLNAVIARMQNEIARALPVHLKNNAERYGRQLITLYQSNRNLQRCTLGSQLGALMTAAALGLDLSPTLGQCYIIPYKDAAQFQLGYKGAIDLAMRSGRIARIYADVVHEKDTFEYSKGLHGKLIHEDAPVEDRGEITHVYALAEFTNGGYAFDVWTKARVVAHAKKFSRAYNSGPWQTDWEAMAKKTLILAIWKYLPISTDIQAAYASDNAIREISVNNDALNSEKDVLDMAAIYEAPAAENEAPKEAAADGPLPELEPVDDGAERAKKAQPKSAREIVKDSGTPVEQSYTEQIAQLKAQAGVKKSDLIPNAWEDGADK